MRCGLRWHQDFVGVGLGGLGVGLGYGLGVGVQDGLARSLGSLNLLLVFLRHGLLDTEGIVDQLAVKFSRTILTWLESSPTTRTTGRPALLNLMEPSPPLAKRSGAPRDSSTMAVLPATLVAVKKGSQTALRGID